MISYRIDSRIVVVVLGAMLAMPIAAQTIAITGANGKTIMWCLLGFEIQTMWSVW